MFALLGYQCSRVRIYGQVKELTAWSVAWSLPGWHDIYVGSAEEPSRVAISITFCFRGPLPQHRQWGLADKLDSCLPFSSIYCKAGHPRLQASFCSLDLTYAVPYLDLDFLGAELSVIWSTDQSFVSGGTLWVRNLISISLSKLRGVGVNQYLVTPLSWTHPD